MRADDGLYSYSLFLELATIGHVDASCYACGRFGGYMFRVTMNGQLRTGTDKGNPTV